MKKIACFTREIECVVEIVCNKCGKTINGDYCMGGKYSGGFDSDASTGIKDGDVFSFELCEACLAELMRSFKIKPEYSNFIFQDVDEWDDGISSGELVGGDS